MGIHLDKKKLLIQSWLYICTQGTKNIVMHRFACIVGSTFFLRVYTTLSWCVFCKELSCIFGIHEPNPAPPSVRFHWTWPNTQLMQQANAVRSLHSTFMYIENGIWILLYQLMYPSSVYTARTEDNTRGDGFVLGVFEDSIPLTRIGALQNDLRIVLSERISTRSITGCEFVHIYLVHNFTGSVTSKVQGREWGKRTKRFGRCGGAIALTTTRRVLQEIYDGTNENPCTNKEPDKHTHI